jgi:hypothetical protein
MIVQDVIQIAWQQLLDTEGPHRYEPERLIPYVDGGVKELLSIRDDLRRPANGPVAALTAEYSQAEDTLPVGNEWRLALAEYVTAYTLSEGNVPADGSAAAMHLQNFYRRAGVGNGR